MLIRKPILAGVRTIAFFEATKGGVVLLAGLGLLALIHRDVQSFAERIVRHSHLNPASHYPRIFLDAARHVTDKHLWLMALGAALYAAIRGVEAYGLWTERRWAEWFALAAGASYIPVEVYELFRRLTWMKMTLFTTNIAIVGYMIWVIVHSSEQDRELAEPNTKLPLEHVKKL